MAKSSRASTKKANNSSLRAKVFGPVEDARTSRVADKLMEIAAKSASSKGDVEMNGTQTKAAAATGSTASDKHKDDNAMEVQPTTRKVKIMKATDSRDKREKRKTFRKNRSSTTFSSRITRSSKRKS